MLINYSNAKAQKLKTTVVRKRKKNNKQCSSYLISEKKRLKNYVRKKAQKLKATLFQIIMNKYNSSFSNKWGKNFVNYLIA